jgi:hypothetical protein
VPRFLTRCAGFEIKVKDMDHLPPHCHAVGPGFRDQPIRLDDLKLLWGSDRSVRSKALRDCLRLHRVAMRKAWDDVIVR